MEHGEHFTSSAGGPVWEPNPSCPTCMGHEMPAPVDWPARFRAAAEAAQRAGQHGVSTRFDDIADILQSQRRGGAEAIEAVGRALLGDSDR